MVYRSSRPDYGHRVASFPESGLVGQQLPQVFVGPEMTSCVCAGRRLSGRRPGSDCPALFGGTPVGLGRRPRSDCPALFGGTSAHRRRRSGLELSGIGCEDSVTGPCAQRRTLTRTLRLHWRETRVMGSKEGSPLPRGTLFPFPHPCAMPRPAAARRDRDDHTGPTPENAALLEQYAARLVRSPLTG